MMLYPVISQLEIHRQDEYGTQLPNDMEMHLLTQLPDDELVWYCDFMAFMGDVLISTGTKLKGAARPTSKTFQETP
jgi:hypothetical protein